MDLLEAVFRKDLAKLNEHLDKGANVNQVDGDGRTPLMHATLAGDAAAIAALIAHSAKLDAQDGMGYTALHFACQDYRVEAASHLVMAGAPIDVQDSFGNTPLWRGVFNSRGRGEIISLLLKRGANANLKNKSGVSPLDLANTIANYDVKRHFSHQV